MWWLCYQRSGRLLCVVIVEASSLSAARLHASIEGLGRGGVFSEGHALDARCVGLLRPDDVGRMLSPAEADALLARFEPGAATTGKRPPAGSVRRRARARETG
jgi:hypothetical protein